MFSCPGHDINWVCGFSFKAGIVWIFWSCHLKAQQYFSCNTSWNIVYNSCSSVSHSASELPEWCSFIVSEEHNARLGQKLDCSAFRLTSAILILQRHVEGVCICSEMHSHTHTHTHTYTHAHTLPQQLHTLDLAVRARVRTVFKNLEQFLKTEVPFPGMKMFFW